MYIRAHAKYGVIPLVQRVTDLKYYTVFITAADSSIYLLSDLKGRQFAFGDIDSTSGHLMPLLVLKQAGIDPENDLRLRYSGSHVATAVMVQAGVVDAGAMDKSVFDFLLRGGKVDSNRVRIFYYLKTFYRQCVGGAQGSIH
jgi:phosphonate transport system substrate-binding protein